MQGEKERVHPFVIPFVLDRSFPFKKLKENVVCFSFIAFFSKKKKSKEEGTERKKNEINNKFYFFFSKKKKTPPVSRSLSFSLSPCYSLGTAIPLPFGPRDQPRGRREPAPVLLLLQEPSRRGQRVLAKTFSSAAERDDGGSRSRHEARVNAGLLGQPLFYFLELRHDRERRGFQIVDAELPRSLFQLL